MTEIVNQLKGNVADTGAEPAKTEMASVSYLSGRAADGSVLGVTIDQIPHPAYMVNYNFESRLV